MSVLVHIGQCGNQVGGAYWRLAQDEFGPSNASAADTATRKRPAPVIPRGGAAKPSAWLQHQFFHSVAANNPRVLPKARCIVVDSEPKVVQSIWNQDDGSITSAGVSPSHVHVEHAGRGNNWAMGYNFQQYHRNVLPSTTTPAVKVYENEDRLELMELVMDSLQKEIESVDCYQGVVLTHSMGGGTGAGLGCRVMECIRDTYAKSYLVTLSIAPSFQCGDTPLQNYNAAFTFSHLQQYADCVIFKDNDDLLRTAGYWKAAQTPSASVSPTSKPRISLVELNQIAAADLAGLLFPVVPMNSKTSSSALVRPFDFGAFIQEACPISSVKFVDVRTGILRELMSSKTGNTGAHNSIPHGVTMTAVWPESGDQDEADSMQVKLTRQTLQAFRRPPSMSRSTIASWAIVRGVQNSIDSGRAAAQKLAVAVDTSFPRVGWNTASHCAARYSSESPFASQGGRLSVTVCVNNGHVVPSVRHVLQRAQAQFRANAYTHWYKQHGLEDEAFQVAFENCNQLICEYENALRC